MARAHRARVSCGVIALVFGPTVAACGVFNGETSRQMVPASRESRTEAVVLVRPGDNGLNKVTIRASDVAPPERVASGATTYVVWIRAMGKPTVKAGVLHVDANRRGFLETTTRYESFTVLVTAEPSAGVEEPLGRAAFAIGATVK